MKYTVFGSAALLAGMFTVSGAHAQQRPPAPPRAGIRADSNAPRPMQERMQPRGPEMNPGHPAGMILRLRQQLDLTDAQVQRLEALRQTQLPQVSQSAEMRARADLLDATRGDGNIDAARTALDRMAKLRTDQAVARLRARKEARDVLTATQKTRLDQMESRVRNAAGKRGAMAGHSKRAKRAGRARGGRGMGGQQGGGMRGQLGGMGGQQGRMQGGMGGQQQGGMRGMRRGGGDMGPQNMPPAGMMLPRRDQGMRPGMNGQQGVPPNGPVPPQPPMRRRGGLDSLDRQ